MIIRRLVKNHKTMFFDQTPWSLLYHIIVYGSLHFTKPWPITHSDLFFNPVTIFFWLDETSLTTIFISVIFTKTSFTPLNISIKESIISYVSNSICFTTIFTMVIFKTTTLEYTFTSYIITGVFLSTRDNISSSVEPTGHNKPHFSS